MVSQEMWLEPRCQCLLPIRNSQVRMSWDISYLQITKSALPES